MSNTAFSKSLLGIVLLGTLVLTPSAHAEPYVVRVPCSPQNRPNLTGTELQVWKDLCEVFNSEGNAELKADHMLQELKKSKNADFLGLPAYANAWIKLYEALRYECQQGRCSQ